MAAADYYKASVTMRTDEEELEIQAQDIDQKTLLFQAQLRGFLLRHRVSLRCKDDVAIENKGHLTSINTRSPLDTRSTISDMVNERRTSDTNKILNKNAKNAQYGDEYPKRDNLYVFDVGHTPGKAESTDLQARYQELSNSAANASECDQGYRSANETTDDILDS